ncbi:hypothetical protein PENTCL1PPCAC_29244, partial [Pristionchus entomophagus]
MLECTNKQPFELYNGNQGPPLTQPQTCEKGKWKDNGNRHLDVFCGYPCDDTCDFKKEDTHTPPKIRMIRRRCPMQTMSILARRRSVLMEPSMRGVECSTNESPSRHLLILTQTASCEDLLNQRDVQSYHESGVDLSPWRILWQFFHRTRRKGSNMQGGKVPSS